VVPPGRAFLIPEHRYFSDPARGNYVTYIKKFGLHVSHGHWQPHQPYKNHSLTNITPGPTEPYVWETSNWAEIIREHIARLEPKPDYLVFNAGLHPNRLREVQEHTEIREALQETGLIGIYKTTTYPKHIGPGMPHKDGSHDQLLCEVMEHCLDMSWTAALNGTENYYDQNHFKAHVNTRMNVQLLEFLEQLQGADSTATSNNSKNNQSTSWQKEA